MNNDELWNAIHENLDQHHYAIAIEDLKKIYEDAPAKRTNQLLVQTLLKNKDYLSAKEYMLERINDYQDSEADFKLMIQVFILNQNFIQSQIMINTIKISAVKDNLQQYLDQQTAKFTDHHGDQINQIENGLYHIGGLKLVEQRKLLAQSMNIPVDNYFDGANGALRDPFLNPAIRFNLLDILRELQIDQSIEIAWLDKKMYQINLIRLVPLMNTKSAIGIFNTLEQRFGQTSPDLFQNMVKTFNLFLAYLYPFNDQLINDYDAWVTVAYEMQSGIQPDLSDHEEKRSAYKWQSKLLRLIESAK
ncbi:hypothetical protein ACYATM_06140 [Lactobacillaceae bacterium Scapto_B20]